MTQIIYSDIFPSNNEGVKGTAKPVITSEELDGILETIDYIYDDGILSVSEKISITIPLDGLLEASYSAVIARASELGLSYTALTTARSEYLAVRNALVPAWNNKGAASPLNGLDLRGKILAYQSAIKSAELAISREDARRAEWPLIPAGTGKPEDNADVTAGKIAAGINQQGSLATKNWVQLGSDLRNALGTITLQDFDVITGEAISAGELPNWNFGIIDKDGLPAGFDIVEGTGISRQEVIEYTNFARAAVRLKGGRTYGAGFIAMPVDDKRTYLISIRHRSTGSHSSGLYIRMNERASAPPAGDRYITGTNRSSFLDMRSNAPMPGTSWVEEVLSYTPTSGTKFASLSFYNWGSPVDYEIDYAHMSNSVFEGRLNALSTLNGPMEAGANVTEGRISYGFLGQTPWATLTSNIGRVSRLDDTGTLQAQNIYNPGIAFLDQRWPAELGSNVTETRIAQGIQFQGALATANQASWTAQISGRPVELTDGRIGSGLNAAGFLKSGINAGGPLSLSPSEVFSLLAGTSIAYDPEFQRGVLPNEISVYNNAGTSTVSLSVITDQTAPNGSKKVLRVSYSATDTTFPGYGGFTRLVSDAGAGAPSRTNRYARGATYLVKVVAKIPAGRTINFASNPYGDGGDFIWLTSQAGTGNYETYFARQQIGKTGSFQQTGFFFVDGGPNTAFTWDVAISDYIEMTGANRVFLDQGIITGADGVVRLQNQLVTSEGIASAINNQGALATLNNINLDNPAVVTLPGRLAPSPIHGGGWLSAVNVAWEDLGGGTVHQWKPQEPAANITENRVAQAINGQTPWATFGAPTAKLTYLNPDGTMRLGSGNGLLNSLGTAWLTDSNVITEQGTAAAIANQGAWATTTVGVGDVTLPGANLIFNASLQLATQGWTVSPAPLYFEQAPDGNRFIVYGPGNELRASTPPEFRINAWGGLSFTLSGEFMKTQAGNASFYGIEYFDAAGGYITGSYSQVSGGWNRDRILATCPAGTATVGVMWSSANVGVGDAVGMRRMKLEYGTRLTPIFSDEATNGALFRTGVSIDALRPQEFGSNVTESRIAQGFNGQTPWATLTSNIGRVSRLDDAGTLQAQNIYNPGIAFLDQRWPAENSANVTETRIAQGIQFQGPGATASGNDVLNNRRENEVLRIPKPVGASYSNPNANAPGSIRIRLPVSWSYTMLQFTVDIFDYNTNRTVSLVIAGYNYGGDGAGTPAQWFNWSAHITGGEGQRFPVYFGYSSGLCTIWIGNTSNLWQYPKVTVRDFMAGHTNYELSQWDDGWIIDLDTTGPRNETGGPVHSVLHPTPGDALFGSNIFEGSGLGVATTSNFKTQLGTAAGIANQGAFATLNQVDLDNTARFIQPPRFEASAFGGTWFRADRVAWGAGNTVEGFKPQEPSANITENRISSGIAGQGALATANNISYAGPVITGKPTNIGNRSIIPGERFDNSFPWDRELNIVQLPDEPAVLSTAANPQSFMTNFGNAQPVDQDATYEYTYEVYQDGPNRANWYSVICLYNASQNHLSGDGSFWHYPVALGQAIEPYRWIKYAHRFGRGGIKEIPTNAVRMGMGMLLSFGGSGDPMYVRRMCVRKIPYLDWSDPGDGRLSFDVGSVTKNPGWEGLWGAVTVSRNSITGPQTISAMATTDALGYANSMFGLTDGPVTNYSNIDYAWHPQQFGLASIYENGVFIQQIDIGNFGLNFSNAKFSIEYDGLRVAYLVNGIVVRRVTTSANRGFRGAIDINSPGAGLAQIEHYSTNSVSLIGDNTFRTNGNFLGTASLITAEGTAAAIANQGALATINIVDVDNPSQVARPNRLAPSPQHGSEYLAANRIAYIAGDTAEGYKPQDYNSNRTENRVAAAIAGQKSGATSASLSEMNAKEGLRLKGLDDTNNMIRNSFDLSDVIFDGGSVFREANPNGAGPARDNFRVRHDPNQSLSYFNSGDFITVRPNERLYVEFTVYHAANAGAYGRFYLRFYSTNNTYLGDVILSHGSENGTGNWFRRKFAGAVPANAAKMLVFTYTGSDHTSGSIYFTEPFLSRYEEGSDVTSSITGAATITIKHDSAGTALSGQLPRQEQYRLIRNGVDVTSQSTWTVEVISGTVSGAVNSSNGLVQINSITSSAKLRLTATYLSTVRRMEIDVVREVAATSYGGGGSANDNTLSPVSTTSHNVVSNELTVICGSSGVINAYLTAEILANVGPPTGTFNVYAVTEEWNGSTWVEIHSEVMSLSPTGVTFESGIYYSDGPGAISFAVSVSGRTPGASYNYRLKARASSNKTISFQNANFQVTSGN